MRWVGHVARMGREESSTGFWWERLRVTDHLVDPEIYGRVILRWIIRKWGWWVWTGSSWLKIGKGEGPQGGVEL